MTFSDEGHRRMNVLYLTHKLREADKENPYSFSLVWSLPDPRIGDPPLSDDQYRALIASMKEQLEIRAWAEIERRRKEKNRNKLVESVEASK